MYIAESELNAATMIYISNCAYQCTAHPNDCQHFGTPNGKAVINVKKACFLLLVFCLLLTCAYASKETEDRLTVLSNKSLIELLSSSGYKGWSLYQPGSREEIIDTSSISFLNVTDIYPIVARKDSETHLLILQNGSQGWEIKIINDKALTRDGFRLFDFSVDENISSKDDTMSVYFDFADAEDRTYTLGLDLSQRFHSFFRFLELPGEDMDSGYVSRIIVMNYLQDFCFEIDYYGGAFRETIGVKPWHCYEFDVEKFVFANMPLSIYDLSKRIVVNNATGDIGLYRYPIEVGDPVLVLHKDETVNIVRMGCCDNWMIVCAQENLYFARCEMFQW